MTVADPALAVRDAPEPSTRAAPAPATLTALAVAALLAALLFGQVLLVAFAAPLAVAAVAGLARRCPARLDVSARVDRLSTVEGEPVRLALEVGGDRSIDRLEIAVEATGALAASPPARAVTVPAGAPGRVELEVPCPRWGVGVLQAVLLRWRDPAGVVSRTARVEIGAAVRVLPASQVVRALARTEETQLAAGNAVARELGQGIEFGEVRPYAPGDRRQAVNWRVSARRGGLWVTDRHVERNVDVVLAVDAVLADALPAAVRAAAALAEAYLAERDRVGLVGIGGTLRWLRPGGGAVQRHRLVEELIAAQAFAVEAWGGGLVVPRHGLPPRAFVIALSSLLDDRSAGVLLALRDGGHAMAVVEVGAVVPPAERDPVTRMADRLWRLSRDARRLRLLARGVPVARWREGEPLEAAMAEIAAYRRALRRPAG